MPLGLFGVAAVVLIVLKLCGVITLSWWWIVLVAFGGVVLLLALFFIAILFGILSKLAGG